MSGARGRAAVVVAAASFTLVALAASAEPVPLADEGSQESFVQSPRSDDGADSDGRDDRRTTELSEQRVRGAAFALVQFTAMALMMFVVAVLGRALFRRMQQSRDRDDGPSWTNWEPGAPSPELSDAVVEGMATLESGSVDDAIVNCWLRLEEAAAGIGAARQPSETATELTVRLLGEFDVPEQHASRLLELYCAARYSEHRLGEQDRAAARAALGAIGVAMEKVPS